jgi:hypothetical protein
MPELTLSSGTWVAGVTSLRWRAYDLAVQSPSIYPIYSRIHPTLRRLSICPMTRFVIEGFPRSANTYAVVALEAANGRQGRRLAHHTHSSVTIMRACHLHIPILFLIRRPEDAVLSLCARYPGLSSDQGLSSYIRFHQKILPVLSDIYVARFEDVVEDFGSVIAGVNDRYGLRFSCYTKTPEAEASLIRRIDEVGFSERSNGSFENNVARANQIYFSVLAQRAS